MTCAYVLWIRPEAWASRPVGLQKTKVQLLSLFSFRLFFAYIYVWSYAYAGYSLHVSKCNLKFACGHFAPTPVLLYIVHVH